MADDRPKSVRIGWQDYEIQYVKRGTGLQNDFRGRLLHATNVMMIDDAMTDIMTAETILHEILHGVYEHWSLPQAKDKDEEFVVSSMSNGLMSTFANNRKLVAWLNKVLNG